MGLKTSFLGSDTDIWASWKTVRKWMHWIKLNECWREENELGWGSWPWCCRGGGRERGREAGGRRLPEWHLVQSPEEAATPVQWQPVQSHILTATTSWLLETTVTKIGQASTGQGPLKQTIGLSIGGWRWSRLRKMRPGWPARSEGGKQVVATLLLLWERRPNHPSTHHQKENMCDQEKSKS